MRIFRRKELGKHIKWVLALLLLSIVYAIVGINGLRSFGQNRNGTSIYEAPYSVEENKVVSKIPKGQHILLKVGNLPERQETVSVSFYDDQKTLVDSRDIVLCNGMNDLGKCDVDISFFKYSSTRVIDIREMYYAEFAPFDVVAGLKIGMGIFLLCFVQYFLILVKRKYTN